MVIPDAFTKASFKAHQDARYWSLGFPSFFYLNSSISIGWNTPVKNLFSIYSPPTKNLYNLFTFCMSIPTPNILGTLILFIIIFIFYLI